MARARGGQDEDGNQTSGQVLPHYDEVSGDLKADKVSNTNQQPLIESGYSGYP